MTHEYRAPILRGGAVSVICGDCKNQQCKNCRGGTWCDCQHQPPGTGQPIVVNNLKMLLPPEIAAGEVSYVGVSGRAITIEEALSIFDGIIPKWDGGWT